MIVMDELRNVYSLDWLELCGKCSHLIDCESVNEFTVEGVETLYFKKRAYGTSLMRYAFDITIGTGEDAGVMLSSPRSLLNPCTVFFKLSNWSLYSGKWKNIIASVAYMGVTWGNITRLDLCCDSNEMVDGTEWSDFWADFVSGEVTCVRHKKYRVFGSQNEGINSISLSLPTANVGFKSYDKTLELSQGKDKPYIREKWRISGLKSTPTCHVWRAELSLRVEACSTVNWETGEIVNLVSMIDYLNDANVARLFASFLRNHFEFRRSKEGFRKYDVCVLFGDIEGYPIRTLPSKRSMKSGRFERLLASYMHKYYDCEGSPIEVKQAIAVVSNWFYMESLDYACVWRQSQKKDGKVVPSVFGETDLCTHLEREK